MKQPLHILRTVLIVGLFAVAMGYLESAVVIYIRALYYPEGFAFPMKIISERIMITEFWREAATMIMLVGIALLAGKNAITRFAYFLLAFSVWDIFYYVFLWVLVGWPQSLMTWDVLFFIPTTWIGPVIAPVVNSLTMILLSGVILWPNHHQSVRMGKWVWVLLLLGSVVIVVAYTMEYAQFMLQRFSMAQLWNSSYQTVAMEYATTYVPQRFAWGVFAVGEVMHLVAICLVWKRKR
ncbi:MAG: hypothetical protein WCQ95_12620 [Bacteroidota bacterium]